MDMAHRSAPTAVAAVDICPFGGGPDWRVTEDTEAPSA